MSNAVWRIAEKGFGFVAKGIKKNVPDIVSKGGKALQFGLMPEATAKGIVKTAGLSKDAAEVLRLGAQGAELAWLTKSVQTAGGMFTDAMQLRDVATSSGGNEWTASEQMDQMGMKGVSLALNTASIKANNVYAKVGLRAAGLAVGFANDMHETVLDSSRGKATWLDEWALLGGFGSRRINEFGLPESSFLDVQRYYLKKDQESGVFNYGRAAITEV